VIAPKYVFLPLSKWYECNKVLEMKVHSTEIYLNIVRSQKATEVSRQSVNKQEFQTTLLSPKNILKDLPHGHDSVEMVADK